MAKLLACALNADGGPKVEFDPESQTARAIMTGSSIDVVEMDAASNNSVDDIRELRENVGLSPMGGAKRVYILDEAHMLSPAAWNAFLPTLEEPPSHVVFVLATTEAHKVPATIVDRCHRFDFQRPSLEQIASVLRRVAAEEEIAIPEPAVGMIARKASGSFRDALGTLEQLVTYGGREVELDDVLANLGVADAQLILEAAETLAAGDPRAALLAVQKLTESGRDEAQFMRDLSAHLRHLYVIQSMGQVPDSFAVTAEHTDRLAGQAERLSQGDVLRAIDLLAAALTAVKDGSEPRLQLELALLKATQPQSDQSLQALMHRIDRLEAALAGATPAPVTAAAAPPPPPPSPEPMPPQVAVSNGGAVAAAIEEEPEPEPVAALDLERVTALWPAVADAIREQNGMVAALLAEAVPTALEGSRLTIQFPAGAAFSKKKAEANQELVTGALRSLGGHAVAVAFELGEARGEQGPATLTADQLAERLMRDFGAEEIFDSDESESED
jgi:DNA polymerase-3 subunit gamma/tau